MKRKFKIIIAILVFILTLAIFSDWENFKAGLSSRAPIIEITK